MINKNKIFAFIFCITGILLYNIDWFVEIENNQSLYISAMGLSFSFAGLALYISGIKKRVKTEIRVCPKCFFKNNSSNLMCIKCRTPLI